MSIAVDLSSNVAWVTGGASGIGASIVSTLVEAGARVVSLDRAYPAGPRPTEAARNHLTCARLDVTDASEVDAVTRDLMAAGLAPDIVVNNAGLAKDAAVWNLTDDQWAEVLDVNLTAAFRIVRAVARSMRDRRGGAIVNITSINGIRGKFGQANYAASKGGLIALTKTLARELGPRGIRVNAVAPGMIETPMTLVLPEQLRAKARAETVLDRLGRPDDVALAVLFLVSPLAAHITGHVLVVDGGQMLGGVGP